MTVYYQSIASNAHELPTTLACALVLATVNAVATEAEVRAQQAQQEAAASAHARSAHGHGVAPPTPVPAEAAGQAEEAPPAAPREQGAGSREQGAGSREQPAAEDGRPLWLPAPCTLLPALKPTTSMAARIASRNLHVVGGPRIAALASAVESAPPPTLIGGAPPNTPTLPPGRPAHLHAPARQPVPCTLAPARQSGDAYSGRVPAGALGRSSSSPQLVPSPMSIKPQTRTRTPYPRPLCQLVPSPPTSTCSIGPARSLLAYLLTPLLTPLLTSLLT